VYKLRRLLKNLREEDKKAQIVILQAISKLLLTEYMLKFDEKFCVYQQDNNSFPTVF
jgi:hypothetical protein